MGLTYSISSGITYAETFPDFNALLQSLPDNVQRLISPRDVRDSIYTTWENTVFKVTQAGGTDYIGIGQDLLKSKIYFGKKSLNSAPIMNSDLLSNENVDFYFYNTKPDSITNQNTRIAFLAGPELDFTNPVAQLGAPQIESAVVETSGGSQYLDFNILNTSNTLDADNKRIGGNINIKSEVGNVSINDFDFPTVAENSNSNNDGKFLQFVWDGSSRGYGTWSDAGGLNTTNLSSLIDQIGGIYATQVFYYNLNKSTNGYGSLTAGQAFPKVSLHEILTKMLYSIIEPSFNVSFLYSIFESGDATEAAKQKFNFNWNRKDLAYTFTGFTVDGLPISEPAPVQPNNALNTQQSGSVTPIFSAALPFDSVTNKYLNTKTFTMNGNLTENRGGSITTYKKPASFSIVVPFFIILGPVVVLNDPNEATNTLNFNNLLKNATTANESNVFTQYKIYKYVQSLSNVTLKLNSIGMNAGLLEQDQSCLYIAYPNSTLDLTSLKNTDENVEYQASNPPTYKSRIVKNVTSPKNFWGGPSEAREFKVWQYAPDSNQGNPTTTKYNNKNHFFGFS